MDSSIRRARSQLLITQEQNQQLPQTSTFQVRSSASGMTRVAMNAVLLTMAGPLPPQNFQAPLSPMQSESTPRARVSDFTPYAGGGQGAPPPSAPVPTH